MNHEYLKYREDFKKEQEYVNRREKHPLMKRRKLNKHYERKESK